MDVEDSEKSSNTQDSVDSDVVVPVPDDTDFINEVLLRLRLESSDSLDVPLFDSSCSVTGTVAKLAVWNAILNPIGIELHEFEPGKFALSSLNTHRYVNGTDEFVQQAAVAFYWALKTHPCIKKVKIAHHLFLIHCFPLMKRAFLENDSFETLSLFHCSLAPYSSVEFVGALSAMTQLKRIKLEQLKLDSSGFENLSRVLERNQRLEAVSLHCATLWGDVPTCLMNVLCSLPCLKVLSWSCEHLAPAVGYGIAQLLETTQTLQELELLFEEDINPECIQAVASALERNTTVHSVKFYYAYIYNRGAEALASALTKNCHVKYLKLCHCEIGDTGGTAIAQMLKVNKSLEEVDLSENNMANATGEALAQAISVNPVLTKLNLIGNRFGASAVISIARALVSNDVLELLEIGRICTDDVAEDAVSIILGDEQSDLCYNESEQLVMVFGELKSFERITATWGDAGIFELANTVKTSNTIRKVSLEGLDEISVEPQKQLLEALGENSSVEELFFPMYLPCYVNTAPMLADYLRKTTSLKRLTFTLEAVQKDVVSLLADALSQNKTVQYLEIVCPNVDEHAEKCLADMLRQNDTLETLVLNDYASQFEITVHEPLVLLSHGLKENYSVTKFKNDFSWVPWFGMAQVQEVIRRNRVALNAAARFVFSETKDATSLPCDIANILKLRKFHKLLQAFGKLTPADVVLKIEAAKLRIDQCHVK